MAPPAPKSCYVPDCEYATTAGLPTYELLMRDLELHTRYAHPEIPSQGVQGGGQSRPKPDRLPRPTIGEGVTEADRLHFVDKWSRFKRSTLSNATPQHISHVIIFIQEWIAYSLNSTGMVSSLLLTSS